MGNAAPHPPQGQIPVSPSLLPSLRSGRAGHAQVRAALRVGDPPTDFLLAPQPPLFRTRSGSRSAAPAERGKEKPLARTIGIGRDDTIYPIHREAVSSDALQP